MHALGVALRVPVQNLRQRARFVRHPASLRAAPGGGGDSRWKGHDPRCRSGRSRWAVGQRGEGSHEVTQRPGFEQRLLLQGNAERCLEPGDELDEGEAVKSEIPVQHAVQGDSHTSVRRQLPEKLADGGGDHLRPPLLIGARPQRRRPPTRVVVSIDSILAHRARCSPP